MNLNGYPEKFFDRIVRSFLNEIFEKPSATSEPIQSKRIVLFTLPFSGLHSVQIRNQITKLFSSAYPHIQIRCIFRPMQRLSTFFRFKDRIPLRLRSRIVYKYKCQCCNALHCMLAIPFAIFISAFLNTWEFRALLVNHFQNLLSPTFVIIISLLVTLSLLMISAFCPPALHLLNFC